MEKQTKQQRLKLSLSCLILTVILVVIDQLIKVSIVKHLMPIGNTTVIPNVLDFTYVENSGAAFGIFQGRAGLLSVFSLLFIVAILVAIFIGKISDKFLVFALTLIVSGGIGNVIDRISRTFVVDYIDVTFSLLKRFPVFNFADICVTIGAVFLFVYILKSEKTEKEAPKPSENEEE